MTGASFRLDINYCRKLITWAVCLPGWDIATLLHKRRQSEPEAIYDAEVVGHAGSWHVRWTLRRVRMLQTGVVSSTNSWICTTADG